MKKMIFVTIFVIPLCSCQSDEAIQPSSNPIERAIVEINAFLKKNGDLNNSTLEEHILIILANHKLLSISDKRVLDILNGLRLDGSQNAKEAPEEACSGKIKLYELVDLSPNGDWSGEIMQVYFYEDGSTYYVISKDRKIVEKGCFKGSKKYPA